MNVAIPYCVSTPPVLQRCRCKRHEL
jgi:hypothetical protein